MAVQVAAHVLHSKSIKRHEAEEQERKVDDPVSPGAPSALTHFSSCVALCACMLISSYLPVSILPYAGYMALDLLASSEEDDQNLSTSSSSSRTINEENVGSYAGLLTAVFMLGRAVTAYAWGKTSDTYGRTTALYASLASSVVFSLLFGLSTSFGLALLWRFVLGAGNGLTVTVKTAVSELARGRSELETRGMGLVMATWGWGFLLSPILAGALAEPTRQYPRFHLWDECDGLRRFLQEFPFFLPNMVAALFCLFVMGLIRIFVTETLPPDEIRPFRQLPGDIFCMIWQKLRGIISYCRPWKASITSSIDTKSAVEVSETSLLIKAKPQSILKTTFKTYNAFTAESQDGGIDVECAREASGALWPAPSGKNHTLSLGASGNERPDRNEPSVMQAKDGSGIESVAEGEATIKSLLSLPNTRNHLIVYWVASLVALAFEEAFPLFCISKNAGLSLSEKTIGAILSGSGVVLALFQYFVYAKLNAWAGLYGAIRISSLSLGPFIAAIPLALLLNHQDVDNQDNGDSLTTTTYLFLATVLGLYRAFLLAFFTSLIVGLNRTVVPSHRGTMNGLATLGGSVAKAVGPATAGMLASFSLSSGFFAPPEVGAAFMFVSLGVLGGTASLASFVLLRETEVGG